MFSSQALQILITQNKVKCFYWSIVFWVLFVLVSPTGLLGAESGKKSQNPDTNPDFTLTVKDNLITLDAKETSLNQIVEEIGKRMNVDVFTKVPDEKKITIKFDGVPLNGAIERLRKYVDIAYFKDSEDKKITKILVFPKRNEVFKPTKEEGSVKAESSKEESLEGTPQPGPFKFEFDPSKFQEEK